MNRAAVCIVIFLVTLLAVGVPYWQIPYSKVSLPDSLVGFGLLVAFAAALVGRLVSGVSFLHAFAAVGIAVPAAVLARVGLDTFHDPTSHNLWPIEVILAGGVGLAVALGGSLAGGVLMAAMGKSAGKAGAGH